MNEDVSQSNLVYYKSQHLTKDRALEQFKEYEQIGLDLGFRHVESSALVRSSYKAQKHIN